MLLPVENCAEIATIFTSFAALLLTSHVAELARRKKSDFTRSKAGKLPLNLSSRGYRYLHLYLRE